MVHLDREALASLREDIRLLEEHVREVLVPGADYGTVPGIPGPFLFEPGADKILAAYCCYATPTIIRQDIDPTQDLIEYVVEARICRQETHQVVAVGLGVASTREGKWGSRWVANPQDYDLPKRGLRSRTNKSTGKPEYRIPNPDWGDLVHTLAQMAAKRAKVAGAQALPGVSSALRLMFNTGGPARRAPVDPALAEAPSWSAFWGEMRALGLSPDQVHDKLQVQSLKADWVEKGRPLAEARREILRQLGLDPAAQQGGEP